MPRIITADRAVVSVTATESEDWQVVSTPTGFRGITSADFADNDLMAGFVIFENGEDYEVYDSEDDGTSALLQVSNISGTVLIARPATPFASSNGGDRVNAGNGTHTLVLGMGAGTAKRLFRETNPTIVTLTSGDATPSVENYRFFKTSGSTAITAFDDMESGKLFLVRRGDADIVLTHSASSIVLPGAGNLTLTANEPSAWFWEEGGVAYWVGGGGSLRASLVGIEDADSLYEASNVEAALSEARKDGYLSGGTLAASGNLVTVAPKRVYTLTASDTINEAAGLADGESFAFIAPASGIVTIADEATTTTGLAFKLGGENLSLTAGESEGLYVATRVGSSIHIAGAGASGVANVLRKRYVNVLDYVPSDDTQDALSGIQAAIADCAGRELIFACPFGGSSRPYRIGTPTNILVPSKTRVVFADGAHLDITGSSTARTGVSLLRGFGTLDATIFTPQADLARGDTEIILGSGEGAALAAKGATRGKICQLSADVQFVAGSAGGAADYKGEIVYIEAIVGDTVHISKPLLDDYATSETLTLQFINHWSGSFENVQIEGVGKLDAVERGDRGLVIDYGLNVRIDGGMIRNCDFQNVTLRNAVNFKMRGAHLVQERYVGGEATSYNVGVFDGSSGIIEGCLIQHGSSAINQSGSGGGAITREVIIRNNEIYGSGGAINGIGMHNSGVRMIIDRNIVENYDTCLEISVPECYSSFNIFRPSEDGFSRRAAIRMVEQIERFHSVNDVCEGGWYGALLQASDTQLAGSVGPIDINLQNMTCIGQAVRAVSLNYDDTTDAKKGLQIKGLRAERQGNVAVEVAGTFSQAKFRDWYLQKETPSATFPYILSGATSLDMADISIDGYQSTPNLGSLPEYDVREVRMATGSQSLPVQTISAVNNSIRLTNDINYIDGDVVGDFVQTIYGGRNGRTYKLLWGGGNGWYLQRNANIVFAPEILHYAYLRMATAATELTLYCTESGSSTTSGKFIVSSATFTGNNPIVSIGSFANTQSLDVIDFQALAAGIYNISVTTANNDPLHNGTLKIENRGGTPTVLDNNLDPDMSVSFVESPFEGTQTTILRITNNTGIDGGTAEATIKRGPEDDVRPRGFRASGPNALTLSTTGQTVTWSAENDDDDGAFDPVTGIYTTPRAGRLRVTGKLNFNGLTAGDALRNFVLTVDGGAGIIPGSPVTRATAAGALITIHFNEVFDVGQGDTIKLTTQNDTAARGTLLTTGTEGFFAAYYE